MKLKHFLFFLPFAVYLQKVEDLTLFDKEQNAIQCLLT